MSNDKLTMSKYNSLQLSDKLQFLDNLSDDDYVEFREQMKSYNNNHSINTGFDTDDIDGDGIPDKNGLLYNRLSFIGFLFFIVAATQVTNTFSRFICFVLSIASIAVPVFITKHKKQKSNFVESYDVLSTYIYNRDLELGLIAENTLNVNDDNNYENNNDTENI